MVAFWKIGTSDGAPKEHVANLGELRAGMVKDDMARRVSRAMDHVEGDLAKVHRVAAVEPARWREAFGTREAEALALFLDAVDPELVIDMWALDGCSSMLTKDSRAADVINMPMGEKNLRNFGPLLLGNG